MDILRLALMVAALAACAPSLVGLGEIPDAPTRETSGSDSAPAEDAGRADVAPTPSDATDGAVAPDAAPAVDASSPTAADAGDAAEVSVDVAPVAEPWMRMTILPEAVEWLPVPEFGMLIKRRVFEHFARLPVNRVPILTTFPHRRQTTRLRLIGMHCALKL